jgi:hypothetical protein
MMEAIQFPPIKLYLQTYSESASNRMDYFFKNIDYSTARFINSDV